jgi:hypothetical protein
MYVIHLKTTNDSNGNPRRLYLILDTGGPIAVVKEGYSGMSAIEEVGFPPLPVAYSINITPGEYRRIAKALPNEKGPDSARLAQAHKEYAKTFREHYGTKPRVSRVYPSGRAARR